MNEADLCGISTTGELEFSPHGVSLHITPTATDASLQETAACLWHRPVRADAKYSLTGEINLPPTREDPAQFMSGQMEFSSDNGRIEHANVLMKIFSILNVTEVFTGGKSDLTEKGYGYTKAYVKAEIGGGKLQFDEILLDGNSLKITGQGEIDLKDTTVDIILLTAPLKTVDRIVNKLPIISYIIGGSLITVPLRIEGKLSDVSVVHIPPSAVGQGLLGIMGRTLKAPFKLVESAADLGSEKSATEATPVAPTPKSP
ncbi:MAG: AsmA-like C-terminal domain-containing protein [Desulfosarcina sp.]|nr:AsmA-like C-terminal domain-containing protein [Desulfosarcina sp.]